MVKTKKIFLFVLVGFFEALYCSEQKNNSGSLYLTTTGTGKEKKLEMVRPSDNPIYEAAVALWKRNFVWKSQENELFVGATITTASVIKQGNHRQWHVDGIPGSDSTNALHYIPFSLLSTAAGDEKTDFALALQGEEVYVLSISKNDAKALKKLNEKVARRASTPSLARYNSTSSSTEETDQNVK